MKLATPRRLSSSKRRRPSSERTYLDALPYEHVDLEEHYPYGAPAHRK